MKRTTLSLAAMVTLSAAAFLPLPSMAQTSLSLVIGNAPPAPRFESIPAPRHGYEWAPGYWNWEGNRHVWIGGHWERAREGYRYQPSQWMRDDRGYRLYQGGWEPVAQVSYNEIRIAPPPPRYEPVPHPRRGYLWAPGHWEWRGDRHEWISGLWIEERPGYVYAQPAWYQRDGRWIMEPPRWTARGRDYGRDDRMAHRDRDHDHDRDHDGVSDRYDRDRDNDGVPNRYDRDRDGDGVPNRQDRSPDNPRRN